MVLGKEILSELGMLGLDSIENLDEIEEKYMENILNLAYSLQRVLELFPRLS